MGAHFNLTRTVMGHKIIDMEMAGHTMFMLHNFTIRITSIFYYIHLVKLLISVQHIFLFQQQWKYVLLVIFIYEIFYENLRKENWEKWSGKWNEN